MILWNSEEQGNIIFTNIGANFSFKSQVSCKCSFVNVHYSPTSSLLGTPYLIVYDSFICSRLEIKYVWKYMQVVRSANIIDGTMKKIPIFIKITFIEKINFDSYTKLFLKCFFLGGGVCGVLAFPGLLG